MYDLTWSAFILLATFGPSDLLPSYVDRGRHMQRFLRISNPFIYLIFFGAGCLICEPSFLFNVIMFLLYCQVIIYFPLPNLFLSGGFEVKHYTAYCFVQTDFCFERKPFRKLPCGKKFILKTASFIIYMIPFIYNTVKD